MKQVICSCATMVACCIGAPRKILWLMGLHMRLVQPHQCNMQHWRQALHIDHCILVKWVWYICRQAQQLTRKLGQPITVCSALAATMFFAFIACLSCFILLLAHYVCMLELHHSAAAHICTQQPDSIKERDGRLSRESGCAQTRMQAPMDRCGHGRTLQRSLQTAFAKEDPGKVLAIPVC